MAERWNNSALPGYSDVQEIRQAIFGLLPHQKAGIRLASISTMGSPLALFSLIDLIGCAQGVCANQIKFNIEAIPSYLSNKHNKLPWLNFTHPGDPIAYPLEKVLPHLVSREGKHIQIQDVLIDESGYLGCISRPLAWSFLSLINGGNAHGSYWNSQKVAQIIAQTISSE